MSEEKRPLRVLEVIGGAIKNRGQDGFVRSLMENIDLDGLEIDCLVPYDCPFLSYRNTIQQRGIGFYELGIPYRPEKTVNEIYKPFLKFLLEYDYDVIHIHSSKTTMMAMMAVAAKKAGITKVIIHAHNGGSEESLKHRLLRLAGCLSMRNHVDVYCACSHSAAEWKYVKRYAETATIINNGIDTQHFRFDPGIRCKVRKELSVHDNTYVIGNVGSLTAQKNQKFLIRVFEVIAKQDQGALLLLVGGGEDRNMLERMVAEKHLAKKVIFTGNISDTADYYQAMDVFVFPSVYEGFGISAIEAQAAGLPVIASDKVPQDIDVTADVDFLRLDADISTWTEMILKYRDHPRRDRAADVAAAGYDISRTVEKIRRLYLEGW